MNGIIDISIKTRRVAYELRLYHNLTVIQGDSGSGKSILCDLISRKANREGSKIEMSVTNGYACRHLTNEMCYAGMLKALSNSVIFLDEDCDYMYSNEFADYLHSTSNYFVLITRHVKRLSKISIHVNALCLLEYVDGVNRLKTQHTLAEDKTLFCGDIFYPSKIVTEDSDSGYRFFQLIAGDNCKPAKVRTKFVSQFDKLFASNSDYLIIADGGAFGGDVNQVIYCLTDSRITSFAFFLPDSFEEFLLHSIVFKGDAALTEKLKTPWKYVDYSKCISFEQFYTHLLVTMSAAKGFSYSKTGSLSKRFTNAQNVQHLLSLITHVDFTKCLANTSLQTNFFNSQ